MKPTPTFSDRLTRLRRRLENLIRYRGRTRTEVFTDIYQKKGWGSGDSVSGPGSSFKLTESVSQNLPGLLRQLSVKSLLDIPCGDFVWMKQVDLAGVQYIGADIVPDLISVLQRDHGNAERRFITLDLVSAPLPEVGMVFCRHCMIHLPNDDVIQAVRNVLASGSQYLCATTYPSIQANRDIQTGQWRPLNLQKPPFSLPPPIARLPEPDSHYQNVAISQELGVWSAEQLQAWARG